MRFFLREALWFIHLFINIVYFEKKLVFNEFKLKMNN